MTTTQDPRVLAIRFGTWTTSRAHQFHRYGDYGEPDAAMPMDYFFWAIDGDDGVTLVDSGYHPDAAAKRPGRECLIPPVEALRAVGIEPDAVSNVVVTHFHFDHIGNLSAFPEARYVVQRRELDFWTGPHGGYPAAAASCEKDEIDFIVEAHRKGRVDLVNGEVDVAPGISARLVVGHCPGQMVVEVHGETPLVLCSDALHFYEEMDRGMPFNVFFDLDGMFATYDLLKRRAAQGATIVAGHDPRVMSLFPALPGADGLAVSLRP